MFEENWISEALPQARPLPACRRLQGEVDLRAERMRSDASRVWGDSTGSDSRQRPLTRIPSLRLRCARNPTSPRKRVEVAQVAPDGVAEAVLFFAAASSKVYTGQSLVVSHGWFMQ